MSGAKCSDLAPASRASRLGFYLMCIASLFIYIDGAKAQTLLSNQGFGVNDAVLVVGPNEETMFSWQADKQLIPASLAKLATAHLAIEKWGIDHRFKTQFYINDDQLWIRGQGDPFLVSEELEILAAKLIKLLPNEIASLHLDVSYFSDEHVPGRTKVLDPYNAPLSAISANFNTAKVLYDGASWVTAEPQTPITKTVRRILTNQNQPKRSGRSIRVNLIDRDNAQSHFAELLLSKLDAAAMGEGKRFDQAIPVYVNQSLPANSHLVYQHANSRELLDMLRGTLEYSNNFIANQLFVLLSSDEVETNLSISQAIDYSEAVLRSDLQWSKFRIEEGAGLSRDSRMSALQIDQLLKELEPQRALLKRYPLKLTHNSKTVTVDAHAKTGTLNKIHNFAGFITIGDKVYRFVFMFNRQMPYRYRESLLNKLAQQLL